MSGRSRAYSISLAIGAAFALKFALATLTLGTNDILSWQSFQAKIYADGGLQLYRDFPLFNHPPFMVHLLAFWGHLHLPLEVSLRLTSALADVGTAWIMWKLATRECLPISPNALLIA